LLRKPCDVWSPPLRFGDAARRRRTPAGDQPVAPTIALRATVGLKPDLRRMGAVAVVEIEIKSSAGHAVHLQATSSPLGRHEDVGLRVI
jgi:hypothetical protein